VVLDWPDDDSCESKHVVLTIVESNLFVVFVVLTENNRILFVCTQDSKNTFG
jgi:hypothetical protein